MGPEDDEEDGEGSDGVKKKKSKAPNMTRLLKSRMQKLIGKQDERCVSTPNALAIFVLMCFVHIVVARCQMSLWIYHRERNGLYIIRQSRNQFVLKTYL